MSTIEAKGVNLAFGRTIALADISLGLESGGVIGIAGPNGAGKSTFTRVIAGEERADSGEFFFDGNPWDPSADFKTTAVVHQEPQVWPNMTVIDNLLIGQESDSLTRLRKAPKVHAVLKKLDLTAVGNLRIEQCTLATRQRVEIGRAMLRQARCYIFDEPNSALTETESDALFSFMRELSADGHITILISHRLNDLVAQCERVHVIRDGRVAVTLAGSNLTEAAIAAELVKGTEVSGELNPMADGVLAEVLSRNFCIRNWTSDDRLFESIDLDLRAGQITAVVGVEGSGGREFVESIAAFHAAHGELHFEGESSFNPVRSAVFLPADRRGMLFQNLTVGDNLTSRLGAPRVAVRALGWLRKAAQRSIALDGIERFNVKTEGPGQSLPALSGGNQQKVAIAGALVHEPVVLVIEEPTRGVDIGSKSDIYATLRQAAASGVTVLLFCTEIPEVYEVADRLLVMDQGMVILEIDVSSFSDVTDLAKAVAVAAQTV